MLYYCLKELIFNYKGDKYEKTFEKNNTCNTYVLQHISEKILQVILCFIGNTGNTILE